LLLSHPDRRKAAALISVNRPMHAVHGCGDQPALQETLRLGYNSFIEARGAADRQPASKAQERGLK
jgi:hypothetical protein